MTDSNKHFIVISVLPKIWLIKSDIHCKYTPYKLIIQLQSGLETALFSHNTLSVFLF